MKIDVISGKADESVLPMFGKFEINMMDSYPSPGRPIAFITVPFESYPIDVPRDELDAHMEVRIDRLLEGYIKSCDDTRAISNFAEYLRQYVKRLERREKWVRKTYADPSDFD